MKDDNVHKAVLCAFSKGAYSDLTIVCKDKSFKVHKAIVCTQSEFLSNAVKDGFKDVEATAIEAMLHYLYHGDYKLTWAAEVSSTPSMTYGWPQQIPVIGVPDVNALHLSIYGLADRICLVPLRQLAEAKFAKELRSMPFLGVRDKLSGLIDQVNDVAPPDENGRKLRAVVAEVICKRLHDLATQGDGAKNNWGEGKLEGRMSEMAKLGRELTRMTAEIGETDAIDDLLV